MKIVFFSGVDFIRTNIARTALQRGYRVRETRVGNQRLM